MSYGLLMLVKLIKYLFCLFIFFIFCTTVVDETQMIKKNKSPEYCSSELCGFDLSIYPKKLPNIIN